MKNKLAALTVAGGVALGGMALSPAIAHADPIVPTDAEICGALDTVPSFVLLAMALNKKGYDMEASGKATVFAVANTCPWHMAELEDFVVKYGS